MNRKAWHALAVPVCLSLLLACGGSSSSPPPPPVSVSVSPSSADVATTTTQQFRATVTGTSNTAVTWSVAGVTGGNATVGTISSTGLYMAPSSVPSPATVPVTAAAQADPTKSGAATVTIVKQEINQLAQLFPIKLGTTGGNVSDSSTQGTTITCCSGTLGALVSRGGSAFQFILSANHVLARSDQATPGEMISQPGLVDNNCKPPSTIVATLTQAALLKTSNVDAAIAAVVAGAVDTNGKILEFGTPNTLPGAPASTTVTAAINMPVAKSGRSTALTCSSVQSINTTAPVDYHTSCGDGTKFTVTFTNLIMVSGGSFSASGDSGSLIVNSQTAQPVALLFAGNSTNTVGNPIQPVLAALKDPGTNAVPIVVGGAQHPIACPAAAAAQASTVALAEAEVKRATDVKTQHEAALMVDPAVIGVGVGASEDSPEEAAVVIYVDKEKAHVPIPAVIDGVRTKVIVTDRFHATANNTQAGEQTRANGAQLEEALPDSEVARATAVKEKHVIGLMSDPAIIGVGVGRSADEHSSAALAIYVDKSKISGPIPAQLDGLRTKVVRTDHFRSYGWGKEETPVPAACRQAKPAH